MKNPYRKFHLYLQKKYQQKKLENKPQSLPAINQNKSNRIQRVNDFMKDRADYIMNINITEFEQKPSLHKSEYVSLQKSDPLTDFNRYRKDLFERLNRKECEFKFSFEEPLLTQQPAKTIKQPRRTVGLPGEPSVPDFLTTLLKSNSIQSRRQKKLESKLQRKPQLFVEQIVSKRKQLMQLRG